MLIPVTPSCEVSNFPFVEPLQNSGEPKNSQEWQEHDLLLPFSEVGTYIALVNKQDDDFTTLDNSTIDRVIQAGCSNQLAIYLLLHQRSYTDKATGKLAAIPTPHAWLVEKTGFSLSKVKAHIKKLNDAELIYCYPTRQMAEPGNSKQDGNCYGINYRRYTGKERVKPASTYAGTLKQLPKPLEQPVSSYSTPTKPESTQAALSTESEVKVDETALSSLKMNPPSVQKQAADTSLLNDSSKDYLSAKQLNGLSKHLGEWTGAALKHYGIQSLSELSVKQARQLFDLINEKNDLLKIRLNEIAAEIRAEHRAIQTQLDYEAAQHQKMLDEIADRAAQQEQIATYGRVLTLSDKKQLLQNALKPKR